MSRDQKDITIGGYRGPRPVTGMKTVGTSVVALTDRSVTLQFGVQIVASPDNTDPVYVSENPTITAAGGETSSGIAIPPGSGLFFPTDNPSRLRLISSAAAQQVTYLYH